MAPWGLAFVVVAGGVGAFALHRESENIDRQRTGARVEHALIVHGACAADVVGPDDHDGCVARVDAFCRDQQADHLRLCAQNTVRAYYQERPGRPR